MCGSTCVFRVIAYLGVISCSSGGCVPNGVKWYLFCFGGRRKCSDFFLASIRLSAGLFIGGFRHFRASFGNSLGGLRFSGPT